MMKRLFGSIAVAATVAIAFPAFAQLNHPTNPPGTMGSASKPAVQDPAANLPRSTSTNPPTGSLSHPATQSIPTTSANGGNIGVVGSATKPGTATPGGTNAGTISPSVQTQGLSQPVPSPTAPRAAMAGMAPGTMMVAPADRRFARTVAQGNVAEIMTAKLALGKSTSPDVKNFAQKMVDDHSDAGMKLKSIADAKGMMLPTGPDATHRAAYNRLSKLHGPAFDRAYLAGQKTDHMKMLTVLGNEAKTGKDPELMGFATTVMPTVQSHYDMLQTMPMGHQS